MAAQVAGVVLQVRRLGAAQEEAGGVSPVAHLGQLLQPLGAERVPGGVGGIAVQRLPVDPHHRRHVVNSLHPPLDLEGVGSRLHQLGNVADEAEVPGVEDEGAVFILRDRVILAGSAFLHQGVAPAAGMGALPPVGMAAGHDGGEEAASRIGHAEGAVGKDLQFGRHVAAGFADRLQGHLPGQVDAADALLLPEESAAPGGGIGLGREMDGAFRDDAADGGDDPGIGGDEGVEGDRRHLFQVAVQLLQFVGVGIAVDREVDLHPPVVGIGHGLGHGGGSEVVGLAPQAEAGTAQVDGVGAVVDGHLEFFEVPGRGQEFGDLHDCSALKVRVAGMISQSSSPAEHFDGRTRTKRADQGTGGGGGSLRQR